MKLKKLLAMVISVAMILGTMSFSVFAEDVKIFDETALETQSEEEIVDEIQDFEEEPVQLYSEDAVASVGSDFFNNIDDAIAAWTNGKTLTLLSDVTLSEVFKFNSTESRTLNLGTYTLTAASGQNAIEIVCNGQPTATYGLTVNADTDNPGGITATGKSCIYYRKSGTTKDRVIIRINGGIFNGSYAVNVYSSNRGTNCPQVSINGGIFNGNVNIGHGKLIASGGTFNGWVNCTGDSTAYRQISGGTYKSWQFMTADASNKFWVGTSQANYNVGVYVDENDYLVVGGPVITDNDSGQFGASTSNYGWSSYLKYSSAPSNGLYYENADLAIGDTKSGTITLFEDASAEAKPKGALTIKCAPGVNYSGDITLGSSSSTVKIVLPENSSFNGQAKQWGSNYLISNEEIIDGEKVITYTQTSKPAETDKEASLSSNGINTMYDKFEDALAAAKDGDTVTLYKNITRNISTGEVSLLAVGDPITIDLGNCTITPEDSSLPTFANGKNYIIKNGIIKGDVVNNGGSLKINGTIIEGDLIVNAGSVKIETATVDGKIESYNDSALEIENGKFKEDPSLYVTDGYDVIRHADYYVVANLSAEAKSISVEFEKTDVENDLDNLEGADTYNIVLKANTGDTINDLASADLTFAFDGTPVTGGAMNYTVLPAEGITLTQLGNRYMFNYDGVTKYEDSGSSLVIGTITIDGYGKYTLSTADETTNIVNATTVFDNLVDYYVKDGDIDETSATGALIINKDTVADDGMVGEITNGDIKVPTRTLTVNVTFPNGVKDNDIEYQDMKVEITGNIDGVKQTATYNLGTDEVKMETGAYVVTEDRLVLNEAYTVTVSGAGYRTARYTVTMTDDKELTFWNNVMDEEKVIETNKDSSKVTKNFLAGDIVKDNNINIYDLSAVVSYFGEGSNVANGYAKYDLNRDGVIDSKDVAYVLVSWGE